ncbi:MAG: hypothetical protein JXB17_10540, partial [Bacteroidales bacterium]|nr:hypothetical protein [Bacteroidales bacterium]
MKNPLIFLFILFLLIACNSNKVPKYKNSSLPIEVRINDLVKRMTLEEKVGQLISYFSRDTNSFDETDNFIGSKDIDKINQGVGAFFSWQFFNPKTFKRNIKRINNFQKYM